jgi:hypothetical protein
MRTSLPSLPWKQLFAWSGVLFLLGCQSPLFSFLSCLCTPLPTCHLLCLPCSSPFVSCLALDSVNACLSFPKILWPLQDCISLVSVLWFLCGVCSSLPCPLLKQIGFCRYFKVPKKKERETLTHRCWASAELAGSAGNLISRFLYRYVPPVLLGGNLVVLRPPGLKRWYWLICHLIYHVSSALVAPRPQKRNINRSSCFSFF